MVCVDEGVACSNKEKKDVTGGREVRGVHAEESERLFNCTWGSAKQKAPVMESDVVESRQERCDVAQVHHQWESR